ncbi:YggS family pyridoxal phosphate-dependent enzyme [Candidatus Woesearchaeota archaeon]|nr:YggS family pyridoxal phosphate-dependent enzyme [Candidatus Woesearchaeota archaeon]
MTIKENYRKIRKEVPDDVTIVVAAKTRTLKEIMEVIEAGATDIGENYVQEAEELYKKLGDKAEKVRWHMIGHLQKNKINTALKIFDIIQTVDSEYRALNISKRAERIDKKILVMIEVNIGEEKSKYGIEPEYEKIENLARAISKMDYLVLKGIMAMEPYSIGEKEQKAYFKKMKGFYDKLKKEFNSVDTLSIGMSDSYKTAIDEGSNMIRLGRALFGERK